MSLMGYDAEDVDIMLWTIELVNDSIINTAHPEYKKVKAGLTITKDFLEGLLAEGRV